MTRSSPRLRLEPAGLGPKLHRRDVRRVVDVHRRFRQRIHRRRDPGEVELFEEARAEALRVDVGDARQQAQDELLLAHLQAEHADALALLDGGVLGDVEREARLADRRAGGEDDEVALLEPGRQRVEVGEPGPDAADLAAVRVQVVEPVIGVVEERLERAEPGVDPLLADREELRLGAVDRLLDLGRVLVADPGDPPGGPDQVAQDRLALDDPGVLLDVDRGRRLVGEAGQIGTAADRLELVGAFERLGDGDDVDRLASLVEVEDGGVDPAVGLAIEVGGPEEFGDLDDRVAIDQDGAQDRLLGLKTLRRKAVDHAEGTPSAVGVLIVGAVTPQRGPRKRPTDRHVVHEVRGPCGPAVDEIVDIHYAHDVGRPRRPQSSRRIDPDELALDPDVVVELGG